MSDKPRTFTQRMFTSKWIFWIALLGAVVLDLASKSWADANIRPEPNKTFEVIEGVLGWRWAENLGAAFSIFHGQVGMLLTIATIVLLAVMFYALKADPKQKIFLLALGMVAGGAIGNIYDRALLGFVRDFIYFDFDLPWHGTRIGTEGIGYTIPKRWPIFNIADMAIMGGVGCLLIISFTTPDPKKAGKKTEEKDGA
ncbi:signal peptidase II [Planctomycetota bacterium]|nr:signal peptidase II [Planctomycetota bacterium]